MLLTNAVELSMEHKELLRNRMDAIQVPVSEYDFTNLFLFRDAHDYEVVGEGEFYVRGRSYDGHRLLMPTVDLRELPPDRVASLAAEVDFIYPVPEEWLEHLEGDRFEFSYRDAESDYLYRTEKMARYPGRKLHSKRNLLRQFERIYSHTSHCFSEEDVADALDVLDRWQEQMNVPAGETDYHACREALQKFGQLDLHGVICYVEDEPAGFVLGGGLTDDAYAVHFAKGIRQLKGVYEFLYCRLANHVWDDYEYLNLEQDLGIPALRKAKSSYQPDLLLKKYRVALKSD